MSQVASREAGTATIQTPSAPAVQPAPTPSIDPSEYQRLQRVEQQYKGSQRYYENGKKYGIEKPEDFDRWGKWAPALQTFEKQGFNPDSLARAFQAQHEPGQSGTEAVEGVEEIVGRELTKFQKQWVREQAEATHNTALGGELEELSDKQVADLLGAEAPEALKEIMGYAAFGKYMRDRKAYGDDHPLAGKLGPVGKDGLSQLRAWIKDAPTKLSAAQLAKLGEAAKKPSPPSTTAGATGGQAGANEKDKGRDWMDVGTEKAESALEQRRIRRTAIGR